MNLKETVHSKWYKHLLILLFLIVCFQGSAWTTSADFSQVLQNSNQMTVFLPRFTYPDLNYSPKLVESMVKTLQMSLSEAVIGLILAIPVSLLTTIVVTENRLLSIIFHSLLGLVRTIPALLLAALFVVALGIDETTDVLTTAVFIFSMVPQLMLQAIETIDFDPIETAAVVGTNKMQVAIWSIAPQVLSQFASYAFYAFEMNARASAVLEYVGADGIGVILNSSLALSNYERVPIIILTILVTVATTDKLSERVRRFLLWCFVRWTEEPFYH